MGPIHVAISGAACREDGAKSDRHYSTPATTQREPFQAVPLGPTQAVTAMLADAELEKDALREVAKGKF